MHVLEVLGALKRVEIRQSHQRSPALYSYRYIDTVPIRDTQPALLVNWCELTVTRQRDGQVLYHSAYNASLRV